MTKNIYLLIVIFFSLFINPSFFLSSAIAEGNIEIVMADQAYDPSEITIKRGTTVVWANRDFEPHTVTADDGSFDSSTVLSDQSFSHTFNKPGVYTYHCNFHQPDMAGKIIVE